MSQWPRELFKEIGSKVVKQHLSTSGNLSYFLKQSRTSGGELKTSQVQVSLCDRGLTEWKSFTLLSFLYLL